MNSKGVVFIAGPTGVGKSTIINSFESDVEKYIENSRMNPYLYDYLVHGLPLKGLENQLWFLDQIKKFVVNTQSNLALIEQHPYGISAGYGAVFKESNFLSQSDYEQISKQADALLAQTRTLGTQVLTVNLSASTDILWERIVSRGSDFDIRYEEVDVLNMFFKKIKYSGEVLELDTSNIILDEELSSIKKWIKKKLYTSK